MPRYVWEQWKQPSETTRKVRQKNILNIGVCAIYVTLRNAEHLLRVRRLLVYTDNQAAHAILSRGAASEKDTNHLCARIWEFLERMEVTPWFEWVETGSNPADGPSRLPFEKNEETRKKILDGLRELGLTQRQPKKMWGY